MERHGGGLAVLFRSEIQVDWCQELSSPECMVLDLEDITIVLLYLPPPGSPWIRSLPCDPLEFVSGVLGVRSLLQNKMLMVVGDCNARTGSLSSRPSAFPRTSVDPTEDTRGRWFVDECAENDLLILNGSCFDGTVITDNDSGWTSFQPNGRAVIDYVAVSVRFLAKIREFAVVNLTSWSDHAFLSLCVVSDSSTKALRDARHRPCRTHFSSQSKRRSPFTALPPMDCLPPELQGPPSLLDSLYSELVTKVDDEVNLTKTLYGDHASRGKPRTAWITSACSQEGSSFARAGAGVFWGTRSWGNLTMRIPGNQNRRRASHFAVVGALLESLCDFDLIIVTDRDDIIRTYCFWTPSLRDDGWIAPDSDVIQYAVRLIQCRWG